MKQSIIHKAILEAKKSTHRFRIGAVIFNKKIIISTGHNYTSKSVKRLHPNFQSRKNSVHAEVDAIIKARTNLKGASILVVRLSAKENCLLLSKPCAHCMIYIEHVGIKNIYYSNSESSIERIKL